MSPSLSSLLRWELEQPLPNPQSHHHYQKFEIFIRYALVKSKYFLKIYFHLNFDIILRAQNLAVVGGAGSVAGDGSEGLRISHADIEIEISQPFMVN